MITKGAWKGQYRYDNIVHQQLVKSEATSFELNIEIVDNEHFTGIVKDDLSTGGTEGIGEILGKVINNKVEFIKQMPIMTTMSAKNGIQKNNSKTQRPIYYTGNFSDDKKTISGQWKFKSGFVMTGLMLIFNVANSGTWTMTLVE